MMPDTFLDVFNTITAIVAIAAVIAEVTPTQKDDELLAKIKPVISLLALRFSELKK